MLFVDSDCGGRHLAIKLSNFFCIWLSIQRMKAMLLNHFYDNSCLLLQLTLIQYISHQHSNCNVPLSAMPFCSWISERRLCCRCCYSTKIINSHARIILIILVYFSHFNGSVFSMRSLEHLLSSWYICSFHNFCEWNRAKYFRTFAAEDSH